jgi:steroid 5-alpha reductase family enzyme
MPAPSRNRAVSPSVPNRKAQLASATGGSNSSQGLESNQVVVWAVYCCIAIAVVVVGCYSFGKPMLVRAFPNNTVDLTSSAAALEALANVESSAAAFDKAVELYKASLGEGQLSGAKMALLQLSFYAALAFAALVFVVGEVTGNYSQVDKLWSILPVLYTFFYAYYSGYNGRLLLQSACTLVWGARLTYNFASKGGYHWPRIWDGEEDYRWPVLRAKIPAFQNKTVWRVFHLLFIALYQNILLWVITVPAVAAWSDVALNRYDFIAAAAMLSFIYIETLADRQQNSFQARKRACLARGDRSSPEVKTGFVTEGLWAYSRHPNYCCEQGIWFAYYCFSLSSSKRWINITILGPLLLVSLFAASARFSEQVGRPAPCPHLPRCNSSILRLRARSTRYTPPTRSACPCSCPPSRCAAPRIMTHHKRRHNTSRIDPRSILSK